MITRRCQAWETAALRRAVLRPDAEPGEPLPGDDIVAAVHLATFDGTLVVGGCVVLPEPCPFRAGEPAWRLRGMATAPEHRGRGVGTALLACTYDVAANEGAHIVWCLARETALGFYRRNGWSGCGAMIEAVGLPHLRMWRSVPRPLSDTDAVR